MAKRSVKKRRRFNHEVWWYPHKQPRYKAKWPVVSLGTFDV